MKKTLLATSISALLLTNSAFAIELYNDDKNSFAMGGHLSAGIADNGDTVEVNAPSPRVNFEWKTKIDENWQVDAKLEWAVNYLDDEKDVLSSRLGYVGTTHKAVGRFALGRQWSPYSDVMGIADQPIAFANDFLYNDHGNLGTARANKMLSYGKAFDFSESMALKLGAGWQGEHDLYDSRLQLGLQLQFSNFNVGYAFTNGDVNNETAMSNGFSVGYGSYGKGIFAAGVFAFNENMNTGTTDSTAIEAIGAYGLDNGMNFIVNYEGIDDDDNNAGYSELALQMEYRFIPKMNAYIAYQLGLDSDANNEEDQWMIGVRYYL
jgi:predicted porin